MNSSQSDRSVYDLHLDHWIAAGLVGKVVVIKDGRVLGVYPTAEAAMEAGTKVYGERAFFVSSILPRDATNTTYFGKVI